MFLSVNYKYDHMYCNTEFTLVDRLPRIIELVQYQLLAM